MIIVNELEYVKQILENKIIPKGVSNRRVLLYIAKYYYQDGMSVAEFKDMVFAKMDEFQLNIKFYQKYKHDSYVKDICEKIISGEISTQFRDITSVDIYQSELDIIQQGENDRERKVLFTLFVLAKINMSGTGWVNNELKDIFQMANVTATIKDRALMMYGLYGRGLVGQNHKTDKLGYKVQLGSNDEPIVTTVTSFENLGNQYIATFKDGWKMCEVCGKLYKVKSDMDFSSKYCKQCSYNIKLQKNKQYYHEKHEN